ncbi:MAG: Rpn family recombination-promoting nuclease/putative transposase [Blautia sp.]|nr:Rpn family recombination-promoting nuclease/putative transposase [Blautia sp.]
MDYGTHGIRLDLYVQDDKRRVFNVEVQTSSKKNLPKRMRYYQSVIDINVLAPGVDYSKLKRSFVIFICSYDPFGKGRYIYTFENRCMEEADLLFGDETQKVVVNTKGNVGEISRELKEVLVYLDEGRATGSYTQQLDDAVRTIKSSEEREA